MLLTCDIAFSHLGWAVMNGDKPVALGVIETEKTKCKSMLVSSDYYARSTKIAVELDKVIKTFAVKGILGELPSGGAKSSRAAIQMNMATGIVATVCHFTGLPSEFCTPNNVKQITIGRLNATKPEIMDYIIERFGGKKTVKKVKCKKSVKAPKGFRLEYTYHLIGQQFGVGRFEHIADALGVWLYLKDNGNLAKIF